MKQEQKILGTNSPIRVIQDAPKYATSEEVEDGLRSLTESDYVKLMVIAISFCRKFYLTSGIMEPNDLLHQAILKTLECEDGKRWCKEISMVKHLDKAMENISGHLAEKQKRIVAFPDGLKPDEDESWTHSDDKVKAEEVEELLKSVFGEDDQAKNVFLLRHEGYRPNEIQKRLGINDREYETTSRRILRKISLYLTKTDN